MIPAELDWRMAEPELRTAEPELRMAAESELMVIAELVQHHADEPDQPLLCLLVETSRQHC